MRLFTIVKHALSVSRCLPYQYHDSYALKASAIALFTAKRETCSPEKEVRFKEGPEVYAEREVAIVVLTIYAFVNTLILTSPCARRKLIPGP